MTADMVFSVASALGPNAMRECPIFREKVNNINEGLDPYPYNIWRHSQTQKLIQKNQCT
jgi:hypothetical protein